VDHDNVSFTPFAVTPDPQSFSTIKKRWKNLSYWYLSVF